MRQIGKQWNNKMVFTAKNLSNESMKCLMLAKKLKRWSIQCFIASLHRFIVSFLPLPCFERNHLVPKYYKYLLNVDPRDMIICTVWHPHPPGSSLSMCPPLPKDLILQFAFWGITHISRDENKITCTWATLHAYSTFFRQAITCRLVSTCSHVSMITQQRWRVNWTP